MNSESDIVELEFITSIVRFLNVELKKFI